MYVCVFNDFQEVRRVVVVSVGREGGKEGGRGR
jgi:hypothetical protein